MIIDFHTHMFPDKIAARTIDFLSKTGGDMNPFTDGTWKGLKESTKQAGIDHSIVLPIATRPGQFHTINLQHIFRKGHSFLLEVCIRKVRIIKKN